MSEFDNLLKASGAAAAQKIGKKVGRPAVGKRSNSDYVNRSFFIRRATDLDMEEALLALKRAGVNIDKSELVDRCVRAWLKFETGATAKSCLDEIVKT